MVYLTKKEKALFTNRETEIAHINKGIELLAKGYPHNYSLLGLRKTGKTLLLRKIAEDSKKAKVVFFNIENNSSPPEDFALRFVYAVFYSLDQQTPYSPSLSGLIKIKPKSKSADEIVSLFIEEYEKTKPGRLLLIQKAFELPGTLAKELDIKLIIILDEFQAINDLNNYPQIKNILAATRSSFEHTENIMWIISGSAISLMHSITSGSSSPLFELFTNINLDFFSRQNTLKLIAKTEKMYDVKTDIQIKDRIFSFTRGHPFYTFCIADRLCSISNQPALKDLTSSIFEEVLTPNARIYDHCKYVFDTSIEKARGRSSIKRILEYLSENSLSSMIEISKATRMPLPTVNISLLRLTEVDLIEKVAHQYRICDPILRFWIRNILLEGGDFERIRESRLRQIENEFLKAKTELGIAKEYEFREKLKDHFGFEFRRYLKNNIELDALGISEGITYIVEIKWKNKPTDYKEIANFLEKTKTTEFKNKNKKLFFISKSGFTETAKQFLNDNRIQVLDLP